MADNDSKGSSSSSSSSITTVATCMICTEPVYSTCAPCKKSKEINCACKPKSKEKKCVPAQGSCGHIFHFHCIMNWSRTQIHCPLHDDDNTPWEFASDESLPKFAIQSTENGYLVSESPFPNSNTITASKMMELQRSTALTIIVEPHLIISKFLVRKIDATTTADDLCSLLQPFHIVAFVYCGQVWPSKQFPSERYAKTRKILNVSTTASDLGLTKCHVTICAVIGKDPSSKESADK